MKKLLKAVSVLGLVCSILIFGLIIHAQKIIPDEIDVADNNPFKTQMPYTIQTNIGQSVASIENDINEKYEYKANVEVLNLFPVKSTKVNVHKRRYVNCGGSVFGIKIYTNGVVVVKIDEVVTKNATENPGTKAGLIVGDVILEINGKKATKTEDVSKSVEESQGKSISLKVERGGENLSLTLKPAKAISDENYKAGIWVRDSSAGIGTLTFYDSKSKIFAGLGHAVCDVDTGKTLPISSGDANVAVINGFYKGSGGNPGELCGSFASDKIGSLIINGNTGIYGLCENDIIVAEKLPVAMSNEVKEGVAKIVSTIDEKGPQYYDIEITKIYSNNSEQKNMIIKITDDDLINKTGGIVQGMSGSPIIQNDMLVGAVTHVFVNSPLQGYAIYAQTMLETADSLFYSLQKQAS